MITHRKYILLFLLLPLNFNLWAKSFPVYAGQGDYQKIDGTDFSDIAPGDTIVFMSEVYPQLDIRNIFGDEQEPVYFLSNGQQVIFTSTSFYNIRFYGCRYIRFSGLNDEHDYGFMVYGSSGNGISVDGKSSDIEIDHCEIYEVGMAGIMAKTDPTCNDFSATRDKFCMYNIRLHHNYIYNTGMEAVYLGPSSFNGIILECDTKDTIVFPHLVKGAWVHNNICEYNDLDGLQVSSAVENCFIYNNIVRYDSREMRKDQMSGILIGGGTQCACYNNIISDGYGSGIEIHGDGGRFYNNLIIRAGKDYKPNDHSDSPRHGIFVGGIQSNTQLLPFLLYNNTIVEPKTDGIRFNSTKSSGDICFNNAIVQPGAIHYYDSIGIPPARAYINFTFDGVELDTLYNKFVEIIENAGFTEPQEDDFQTKSGSVFINAGTNVDDLLPALDLAENNRIVGTAPDCGAYEYQGASGVEATPNAQKNPIIYPNPAMDKFIVNLPEAFQGRSASRFYLYRADGSLAISTIISKESDIINISKLKQGIYLYSIISGDAKTSGKLSIVRL